MIKSNYSDKSFIVELLVGSFDKNSSVNYIIRQDSRKKLRLKGLMNYSFDICYHFGSVYYSEDKKACALVLFPDRKKMGLRSLLLDIQFVLHSLDFIHLKKALSREAKIKARQIKSRTAYLWYIGVASVEQGKGIGTKLIREIILAPEMKGRQVILETSNLQTVRWYESLGFTIYNQLDLGYDLYFMKRENGPEVAV